MSISGCGTLQVPQFGKQREMGRSCNCPVPWRCAQGTTLHPTAASLRSHSPSDPPAFAWSGQALTHGRSILFSVPWPGFALPMPAPQLIPQPLAPHAVFASCLWAGSAVLSPSQVGYSTKLATPRMLQHRIRLPCPPAARGEPQPDCCPGLDTGGKQEPRKSPVKAVFEFLAWQQLL